MKYYTQLEPMSFDLEKYRKVNGLSCRKLAQITDVTYTYLHRVEAGIHNMSAEMSLKFFKNLSKWDKENGKEKYNFFPILSNY